MPYTIVSVKNGQSISPPIPAPISENGKFSCWKIGDSTVEFPYTPTQDIEINAEFSIGNPLMEWKSKGLWLTEKTNNYNRLNDGLVICASGTSGDFGGGYSTAVLVSEDKNRIMLDNDSNVSSGSVDYNGMTYYYKVFSYKDTNIKYLIDKAVRIGTLYKNSTCVKTVLDYYFK